MLKHVLQNKLQHERLAALLGKLEQEHGPLDPKVMEEARREWPAHTAPGNPAERS
jgi:hypothetical protein